MKNIIILGVGGNCIDILDTINEINLVSSTYNCIGFLDDSMNNQGKEFYGVKVIGTLKDAHKFSQCYFVNGIGSYRNFWLKESIIKKTEIPLDKFENIIHPKASVSKLSNLGRGIVVLANTTICSNAVIGNHVIILSNSVINHDDVIGDFTCITSGVCISGSVVIGGSCYIGSNSSIINEVKIGNDVLIGMGSNVLKDVEDNVVVAGNPAKVIRKTH